MSPVTDIYKCPASVIPYLKADRTKDFAEIEGCESLAGGFLVSRMRNVTDEIRLGR